MNEQELYDINFKIALLEGWSVDENFIKRHKSKVYENEQHIYEMEGDYQVAIINDSYRPTHIWSQGGPILERKAISVFQASFDKEYYTPVFEYGNLVYGENHSKSYLLTAMLYYINNPKGTE